jgi:hypothetical protein
MVYMDISVCENGHFPEHLPLLKTMTEFLKCSKRITPYLCYEHSTAIPSTLPSLWTNIQPGTLCSQLSSSPDVPTKKSSPPRRLQTLISSSPSSIDYQDYLLKDHLQKSQATVSSQEPNKCQHQVAMPSRRQPKVSSLHFNSSNSNSIYHSEDLWSQIWNENFLKQHSYRRKLRTAAM